MQAASPSVLLCQKPGWWLNQRRFGQRQIWVNRRVLFLLGGSSQDLGYVANSHGDRKSHRFLVVGPLINGRFIACKWGWSDHHLRPSWDDPPSTVSSLDKKHLRMLRNDRNPEPWIHQSFSLMISLLYDICMEKNGSKIPLPQLEEQKKQQSKDLLSFLHPAAASTSWAGMRQSRVWQFFRFSCRLSTKVAPIRLSTTRKLWHFPYKQMGIFCIYPYPVAVAHEGFVRDSLLNHHQSTSGKLAV